MAWLARRLLVCLSLIVTLSFPSRGSTTGLPRQQQQPSGAVNFTIGVVGAVWCKDCRYAGYVKSKNVSPLPSTYGALIDLHRLSALAHATIKLSSSLADAAALLRCRRGDQALSVRGATDARGYFRIQAGGQAAVPFKSKDCVVYVPRSPRRSACGVAVQPRRNKGSPRRFREYVALPDGLQALYTAGNFAFGPRAPAKC